MGQLLGFPDCCQHFFRETWVEQSLVDTTWPMATSTKNVLREATNVEVDGSAEANILWRWMGIRAVPHLPCSFECEHTVALGKKLVQVGRDTHYNEEMDWLMDILDWPVEWSALHGIAEIKTPILKVSTRTDATSSKYVVRREGQTFPSEGAQGLRFPYKPPLKPFLTKSPAFQRGLDNPIFIQKKYPEWYAADNGFTSRLAMEKAHEPIVELAAKTLAKREGNVLDIGCGNGALLKQLCQANPDIIPYGLEYARSKVNHASELLPKFVNNFVCGNMFEDNCLWTENNRYILAILMPGRLVEVGFEQSKFMKSWIRKHCDNLLIYAYGDWLTRYKNLGGLAQAAGISLLDSNAEMKDTRVSLARIE